MNLSYSDTLYAIVGFGAMALGMWALYRHPVMQDLRGWVRSKLPHTDDSSWATHYFGRPR